MFQVNDIVLYGESHVTIRQALAKAASNTERDVILTLARKAQQVNLYLPSPEQSLPLAYPLLAAAHDDRVFKAKSETSLWNSSKPQTSFLLQEVGKM